MIIKKKQDMIFIGTPKFAATILEGLIQNVYNPVLVVTTPDKPVGRKQKLVPSEVKLISQKHNLNLIQPTKLTIKDIKDLNPDLIILSAYGQILSKDILDLPKYGSINIHPSLLPEYRGASPIQTTILNNDKKTGVTIYFMDEKMDHGKILSNIEYKIPKNIYYKDLEKELSNLGTKLLIKTLPKIFNNEINPQVQNESKTTYTNIIKKENGKIDWNKSAQDIEAQIRAFHIWPGSFTFWNNKRLKILQANAIKTSEKHYIGQAFTQSNKLCIQCKKDCLNIKQLQLEGKNPVSSEDFLRGNSEFINTILK